MKFGLNTPRYLKVEYSGRSIDDLSDVDKKQKLFFRDGDLDRLVVAYNLNTVDGLREAYEIAASAWAYGNDKGEEFGWVNIGYLWHRLVVKCPWVAKEIIKKGFGYKQEINRKESLKRILNGLDVKEGMEGHYA